MYVSEYLSHIIRGDVKNLYVSDIGTTSPNAVQIENTNILISYLNLANLELHKRFALIQKEHILTNVTNNSLHSIPTDFLYAISATFDDGREVAINNERTNFIDGIDYNVSVLFPAPFKALVKGLDTKSPPKDDISIVYVSIPPVVTLTTDFIDLPQVYNEALFYYVAFKAHAAIKGDMKEENNTYFLRYNESIKNIRLLGMKNSDNLDSNVKLIDRGFV